VTDGPVRVRLSHHAERRLRAVGAARDELADSVLRGHPQRRRNPKEADWLVSAGHLTIAYNWPDRDDPTVALIVTMWRR
jgi:hypothetical protein